MLVFCAMDTNVSRCGFLWVMGNIYIITEIIFVVLYAKAHRFINHIQITNKSMCFYIMDTKVSYICSEHSEQKTSVSPVSKLYARLRSYE